ncbi:hypothetical protein ACJX0J_009232, partial [Zea mays]
GTGKKNTCFLRFQASSEATTGPKETVNPKHETKSSNTGTGKCRFRLVFDVIVEMDNNLLLCLMI